MVYSKSYSRNCDVKFNCLFVCLFVCCFPQVCLTNVTSSFPIWKVGAEQEPSRAVLDNLRHQMNLFGNLSRMCISHRCDALSVVLQKCHCHACTVLGIQF